MKLILAASLITIISSGVLSESHAQFEGAVWDTLTSDTLRDALSRQPFAATPGGLHLTHAKSRGMGNGWSIHYRFFDVAGGWSDDIIVESDLPAFSPSIAAKEFDAFKIAIFFDAYGDIYGGIAHSPWDSWNPVNLTDSPAPDLEPTVAVDDEGSVHVAWITEIDGEYEIAYGKMDDDTLVIEIIHESEPGPYGSGAAPKIITVDNLPHVFYRGVNSGSYHIHHAFRESPGAPWEIEFLYSGNIDDYLSSAVADDFGDIHLAISGNEGWGMPGRIYYNRRDHESGQWTSAELASGSYSVVEGSVGITDERYIFIVSAGISGNFFTGDIFLSNNIDGSFQTEFLTHYDDCTGPAIAFLPGSVGALVLQGIIGEYNSSNMEIISYMPERTNIADSDLLPRGLTAALNYPNPFNSNTIITASGDFSESTPLEIFDLLGRKVRTLRTFDGDKKYISYRWDGLDDNGLACSNGIYFYFIETRSPALSGKMTLVK
ncbi:MAG: T9SS type A sorting domain-containing protein [candidate division Zixibacteria bacterium]